MPEPIGPTHEQRDSDTHDRNPKYPSKHPKAVTNEEKAEYMAHAELPLRTAAKLAKEGGDFETADILTKQAIKKADPEIGMTARELEIVAISKELTAKAIESILEMAEENEYKSEGLDNEGRLDIYHSGYKPPFSLSDLLATKKLKNITEKEKHTILMNLSKSLSDILLDKDQKPQMTMQALVDENKRIRDSYLIFLELNEKGIDASKKLYGWVSTKIGIDIAVDVDLESLGDPNFLTLKFPMSFFVRKTPTQDTDKI